MNADISHQTASAGKGALNELNLLKVENLMDAESADHYNKNL